MEIRGGLLKTSVEGKKKKARTESEEKQGDRQKKVHTKKKTEEPLYVF